MSSQGKGRGGLSDKLILRLFGLWYSQDQLGRQGPCV